ncbi:MAG: hypothetical protein Q9220_001823 [cf. Caloplaca sp. 1 TL-2023]
MFLQCECGRRNTLEGILSKSPTRPTWGGGMKYRTQPLGYDSLPPGYPPLSRGFEPSGIDWYHTAVAEQSTHNSTPNVSRQLPFNSAAPDLSQAGPQFDERTVSSRSLDGGLRHDISTLASEQARSAYTYGAHCHHAEEAKVAEVDEDWTAYGCQENDNTDLLTAPPETELLHGIDFHKSYNQGETTPIFEGMIPASDVSNPFESTSDPSDQTAYLDNKQQYYYSPPAMNQQPTSTNTGISAALHSQVYGKVRHPPSHRFLDEEHLVASPDFVLFDSTDSNALNLQEFENTNVIQHERQPPSQIPTEQVSSPTFQYMPDDDYVATETEYTNVPALVAEDSHGLAGLPHDSVFATDLQAFPSGECDAFQEGEGNLEVADAGSNISPTRQPEDTTSPTDLDGVQEIESNDASEDTYQEDIGEALGYQNHPD